ncbi:RNA polymerase sigma factor [Thalassobellus suaedae]|uniref:Sigma factor-like helix-turn-helix DNA-binding protein n=1 Tax=Thalassobellus suaedae TaxID=3074124 RepID=A0ABY9XP55_9FLAO|nr:sigma factor-like helix-turn-helix DNA-binding protein [Flavobacteriaceae bacterium HL-DH14]
MLIKPVYKTFLDLIRKEKTINKRLKEFRDKLLLDIIEEDNHLLNKKSCLLKEEIDKLPLRCKEIFMIFKLKDLKYNQIVDKLNISKNTVENQIGKAYKILRRKLKDVFNLFFSVLNSRKIKNRCIAVGFPYLELFNFPKLL